MIDTEHKFEPPFQYEINHCKCHPETCGCSPFKVVDMHGYTLARHYREKDAQTHVRTLNSLIWSTR